MSANFSVMGGAKKTTKQKKQKTKKQTKKTAWKSKQNKNQQRCLFWNVHG